MIIAPLLVSPGAEIGAQPEAAPNRKAAVLEAVRKYNHGRVNPGLTSFIDALSDADLRTFDALFDVGSLGKKIHVAKKTFVLSQVHNIGDETTERRLTLSIKDTGAVEVEGYSEIKDARQ
jgi:hypothetical protein